MKTKILILSSLLLATQAQASNFYVGGIVGFNQLHLNKTIVHNINESTSPVTQSAPSAINLNGGITFGYQYPFSKSKWALNSFVNILLSSGQQTSRVDRWYNNTKAKVTITQPQTIEAIFSGQYQINSYLAIFAGPIIASSQFSSKSNATAGYLGVTGKFKKKVTGTGLIVGFSFPVSDRIQLRLSSSYVSYPKIKWQAEEPVSGGMVKETLRPETFTTNAAVTWSF